MVWRGVYGSMGQGFWDVEVDIFAAEAAVALRE